MTKRVRVQATINGEEVEFLCEPRQSLLEVLRETLGLTGAKEGCNNGNCGACNVILDGALVNSCLVLAVEINGRRLTTIEGIATPQGLHPLQEKFIAHAALQCGFCTPGFIVAAKALLDQNPNPSEMEIRGWLAGNLCRCTGYDRHRARGNGRGSSSGQNPMTTTLPVDEKKDSYDVIGKNPLRHDGTDKVTGRAQYGADIRLPGMYYGAMVRSPHAHARILSIDTSKAEAYPGVKAVVTAEDLPDVESKIAELGEGTINLRHQSNNVLAKDKVLYFGHAVAAVAAINVHVAEAAAALIEVEYEVLTPVLDVRKAMQADSAILLDDMRTDELGKKGEVPSNVAAHYQIQSGDLEKGFQDASVIVEREFFTSMVHQGYIEPQNATAQV